jgi:hypothetical protein
VVDVKRLESLVLELLPDVFFLASESFLFIVFNAPPLLRNFALLWDIWVQCAFVALLCLLDAVKIIVAIYSPFNLIPCSLKAIFEVEHFV